MKTLLNIICRVFHVCTLYRELGCCSYHYFPMHTFLLVTVTFLLCRYFSYKNVVVKIRVSLISWLVNHSVFESKQRHIYLESCCLWWLADSRTIVSFINCSLNLIFLNERKSLFANLVEDMLPLWTDRPSFLDTYVSNCCLVLMEKAPCCLSFFLSHSYT